MISCKDRESNTFTAEKRAVKNHLVRLIMIVKTNNELNMYVNDVLQIVSSKQTIALHYSS